jgi:hypothetical protein
MENIITLVMGDESGDGHGQTATLLLLSNLTSKQIEAAYKKGAKKLGIDVKANVASEYEDRIICAHDLKKFTDAGMVWTDDATFLWTDSFPKLYLFTVKVGNPAFEYKEVKGGKISIGGYGLLG